MSLTINDYVRTEKESEINVLLNAKKYAVLRFGARNKNFTGFLMNGE